MFQEISLTWPLDLLTTALVNDIDILNYVSPYKRWHIQQKA